MAALMASTWRVPRRCLRRRSFSRSPTLPLKPLARSPTASRPPRDSLARGATVSAMLRRQPPCSIACSWSAASRTVAAAARATVSPTATAIDPSAHRLCQPRARHRRGSTCLARAVTRQARSRCRPRRSSPSRAWRPSTLSAAYCSLTRSALSSDNEGTHNRLQRSSPDLSRVLTRALVCYCAITHHQAAAESPIRCTIAISQEGLPLESREGQRRAARREHQAPRVVASARRAHSRPPGSD